MNNLFVPGEPSKDTIEDLLKPREEEIKIVPHTDNYVIFSCNNKIYSIEDVKSQNESYPELIAERHLTSYVRALCVYGGKIYEGNDSGAINETLSGNMVTQRFGFVTGLAVHNGNLYDCDMHGNVFETFSNNQVYETDDFEATDICSHDGKLYMSTKGGIIHNVTDKGRAYDLGGWVTALESMNGFLYAGCGDGEIMNVTRGGKLAKRPESVNALCKYDDGFEVLLDGGDYLAIELAFTNEMILKTHPDLDSKPVLAMCHYRGDL